MAQAYANDPYVTVTPQAGTALVFEHRIWHEGAIELLLHHDDHLP